MIEIISPTETRVDGVNYGKVADTIVNNQQLASEIQAALETWGNNLVTENQTLAAGVSELEAQLPQQPPSNQGNWESLVTSLQQSEVFSRVLTLGSQEIDVNMAVTWLMAVVTSVRSVESLQKSVGFLRLALSNHSVDLTTEELQEIGGYLVVAGFDPAILAA